MRAPVQLFLILIFLLMVFSIPLVFLNRPDEQPITFDNDEEVMLLVEIVTQDGVLTYDSSAPSYLALKLNNSFVTAINISVFIRPFFVGSPSTLRISQGSLVISSISPSRVTFIQHSFSNNPVVIDSPSSSSQYMVGEWSLPASQIEASLGPLPDNTLVELLVSLNIDISLEFVDKAGNTIIKSKTVTASALIRLTYIIGDLLGVDVSFGV